MKRTIKKVSLMIICLLLSVVALTACGKGKQSPAEVASNKVILMQDKQLVTASFTVPAIVKADDGVEYTVTWTSSDEVACNIGTVNSSQQYPVTIWQELSTEKTVKMTATVAKDEDTFTKEFNFTVPKLTVLTFDQYVAKAANDIVSIKGYIQAKEPYSTQYKNTSVYVKDHTGKGGYDAYQLKCTEDEYNNVLKLGTSIIVTGKKTVYSGLYEFTGGCTFRLSGDAAVTPTYTDITNDIKNGVDLTKYQGWLVKYDNAEIWSIAKDAKGNIDIVMDVNGKKVNSRVNTYITPTTSDEYKAIEALKLKVGQFVNFTGVMSWYNSAQPCPLNADSFTVLNTPANDAAKMRATVAEAKAVFKSTVYGSNSIVTPIVKGTSYQDVTVAWSVKTNTDNILSVAAGKYTITAPDTEKTAVVTATVTLGTLTETFDVTIKAKKAVKIDLASANLLSAKAVGDMVTLTDVIVSYVSVGNTYFIVQTTEGSAIISTYLSGDTSTTLISSVKVGDKIDVTGKVGKNFQMLAIVRDANLVVSPAKSTGNAIPALSKIVKLDWATKSNGYELMDEKDFGYVELTNVQFEKDHTAHPSDNYFYFTRPAGNLYRAGIYEKDNNFANLIKDKNGAAVTSISASKKYTVKGYVYAINNPFGTDNSIVRFCAISIVEQ